MMLIELYALAQGPSISVILRIMLIFFKDAVQNSSTVVFSITRHYVLGSPHYQWKNHEKKIFWTKQDPCMAIVFKNIYLYRECKSYCLLCYIFIRNLNCFENTQFRHFGVLIFLHFTFP